MEGRGREVWGERTELLPKKKNFCSGRKKWKDALIRS